jgi:RNA recognition motif-containing protein
MANSNRVFVGNIPYSSLKAHIREHMTRAGEVIDVEIFKDECGYSRGCGLVTY